MGSAHVRFQESTLRETEATIGAFVTGLGAPFFAGRLVAEPRAEGVVKSGTAGAGKGGDFVGVDQPG